MHRRASASWTLATFLALGTLLGPVPARADGEQGDEEGGLPQYRRNFYAKPFVGYSYANALTFQEGGGDVLPDVVDTTVHGFNVGGAIGVKLLFLDLGGRVSYAFFDEYNLGMVAGEIGVRIPLPTVEPYLRVGVGYGWMDVQGRVGNVIDQTPDGVMVDLGLGLDLWLAEHFTLGFEAAAGFYFLSRSAVECALGSEGCETLVEDGDSGALQIRLQLVLGFWA